MAKQRQAKTSNDSPDFLSLAARKMHALASLPALLMEGTEGIRAGGGDLLPKWTREKQEDYNKRLQAVVLFNFFARAVFGLMGRVFSKPIDLGEDILDIFADSDKSDGWLSNVDLQDRDLTAFAFNVALAAWTSGVSYILVEMPPLPKDPETGEVVTPDAVTEKETRRPYLVHVRVENLLGFRYEMVGGSCRLTQVRIRETSLEPKGLFGEELRERVRVLTPGAWSLYVKDAKGDWSVEDGGVTSLDYIPFFPVYGQFESFMEGRPPLLDLAHMNAQHLQSSSDQRCILHFARLPIWAVFGVPVGVPAEGQAVSMEMEDVGPGVIWKFADPEARAEVLEGSGTAIEQGWKDLEQLEQRMAIMAMEPLLPKSGELTATSHILQTVEAHSALQMFALHLENTLETCLNSMAEYAGIAEPAGSLSVNQDFGITAQDAQGLRLLVDLTIAGKFPLARLYEELKRYSVVGPAFDVDTVVGELEKNGPTEGDVQRILGQVGNLKPGPDGLMVSTGAVAS